MLQSTFELEYVDLDMLFVREVISLAVSLRSLFLYVSYIALDISLIN